MVTVYSAAKFKLDLSEMEKGAKLLASSNKKYKCVFFRIKSFC